MGCAARQRGLTLVCACPSLGGTRSGGCHCPVSQGVSCWSFSHLRWQAWTWGMWLWPSLAISYWYSSTSPWQTSSSSAHQHFSQKRAPSTHIHVPYRPCSPPAFLITFLAVPHRNLALRSQPWVPQCRGCTGLLLPALVLMGHCKPHAEWLGGVAPAPIAFPQHPQCCWDTWLQLSQPAWPPAAPLSPKVTLCYDTNQLLWGTQPGRFPAWHSRNNRQWWGKHTGWVSNGGTRK